MTIADDDTSLLKASVIFSYFKIVLFKFYIVLSLIVYYTYKTGNKIEG